MKKNIALLFAIGFSVVSFAQEENVKHETTTKENKNATPVAAPAKVNKSQEVKSTGNLKTAQPVKQSGEVQKSESDVIYKENNKGELVPEPAKVDD